MCIRDRYLPERRMIFTFKRHPSELRTYDFILAFLKKLKGIDVFETEFSKKIIELAHSLEKPYLCPQCGRLSYLDVEEKIEYYDAVIKTHKIRDNFSEPPLVKNVVWSETVTEERSLGYFCKKCGSKVKYVKTDLSVLFG